MRLNKIWILSRSPLCRSHTFVLFVVAIVSYLICGFVSKTSIRDLPSVKSQAQVTLDPEFVALGVDGYSGFAASIAWVELLQSFADLVLDGRPIVQLAGKAKLVTTLDPKWSYPFEFSGLMLSDSNGRSSRAAVKILEDGILQHPSDWRMRVYLVHALQNGDFGMDKPALLDSCAKVLLPVTMDSSDVPKYVRTLAFTMIQASGNPDKAMDALISTYLTTQDPLVQFQLRSKFGDLLSKEGVSLGVDSLNFISALGALFDSDSQQVSLAQSLLIRLVQPETKDAALLEARHLARQFRAFQAAQLGTQQ